MSELSPVTAKRRWNDYRNTHLDCISVVAEYRIDWFNFVFIYYDEISSQWCLAYYTATGDFVKKEEKFDFRKDVNRAFAEIILRGNQ